MKPTSLQQQGQPMGTADSQPVGELVKQASEELSQLVRQEMRLAAVEIKDKGRHVGVGAGLAGGGALVGVFGFGAVLAAVIAALALVLPVWAASLIVGAVLLMAAGVLALQARSQVRHAAPPVPERAMASSKQDVAEIKERAHR